MAYRKYKHPFLRIPAVSRAAPTCRLTPVSTYNGPNSVRFRRIVANRTANTPVLSALALSRHEQLRAAPGRRAAENDFLIFSESSRLAGPAVPGFPPTVWADPCWPGDSESARLPAGLQRRRDARAVCPQGKKPWSGAVSRASYDLDRSATSGASFHVDSKHSLQPLSPPHRRPLLGRRTILCWHCPGGFRTPPATRRRNPGPVTSGGNEYPVKACQVQTRRRDERGQPLREDRSTTREYPMLGLSFHHSDTARLQDDEISIKAEIFTIDQHQNAFHHRTARWTSSKHALNSLKRRWILKGQTEPSVLFSPAR